VIWDLHSHFSTYGGRTVEECMARMVKIASRVGVDRFVIYLGFDRSPDPAPALLRQANDDVLRALQHWSDRAVGFVYLNPNYLDFSLQELDRCVRDGPMVGVKLWVAKRCDCPEADRIVERATRYKAAIFQHTWLKTGGNLPGESTPDDLAALASRHPQARIILGHTGGTWEYGIRSVRRLKHVTIDTAGSDPTAGFLEMAVRELGASRILFGSDAGGRSLASQVGKVMGADIPETARRLILGENLHALLRPILADKGMRFP
jgi:predicted TIM-barrel fold metal-dependent hydrolase